MKVVILGASGQIGSVIHDGLKQRFDTIGTSRKGRKEHVRFDPFADDWSALGQVDVIINCIGLIEPDSRSSFYDVHVRLVQQIISNRLTIGNPGIIQISALGAKAKHKVEFLQTKGHGDEMLLQQPNTVVIRPSIVCTPGTMLIRKLITLHNLIRYTHGWTFVPAGFLQTRIQPVMPQDLVDVVKAVCIVDSMAPGADKPVDDKFDSNLQASHECQEDRIINVVGPQCYSFRELIGLPSVGRSGIKPIEVSRFMIDPIVKFIIAPLFGRQLNFQLYQLLFEDNVANNDAVLKLLKRPLLPTLDFFSKSLGTQC